MEMKDKPRILIACEFSGTVREAFARLKWDAWSCDLLPTERPGQHIQGDVLEVLDEGWDLMIAHPPCTYLCSSGLHWNKRIEGRAEKTEEALEFVQALLDAPIEHIALENPVGCISTRIRKYHQKIQPYEFGHDASKGTCLWLKYLPLLEPTEYVAPRLGCKKCKAKFGMLVDDKCPACGNAEGPFKKVWGNQTATGQNSLGPSEDRWAKRSETYPGIAKAMAQQWSRFIEACRR